MRYMNLEGTHISSINVGGYRHNYEGFYEKILYQMSINRGRATTNKGAHASPGEFSPFFSFSLGAQL